ncbi:MAG: PVC-type heme-binding CxxCH protein, partial [Verrucomicrobiota bacterium]
HNLRNSYENCVTLSGQVFASDNDDQPACRTFAVLEGANYGFASRDGSRSWQSDRRPGQDIRTASWRQEDPGVAPAGDVYGGGAPTGIVYYEDGALGERWKGTLLLCEPARNTVFGYHPERDGEGWKLERFDFLTTNEEGMVIGTDYTGGDGTARVEDTKTLFRPSDIAVGPDGAVYIADWYDARVGGHNDLDETLSGTIYRVAPKGFKSTVPDFDLDTPEGIAAASASPAVHVRALALEGAKAPVVNKKPTLTELIARGSGLKPGDRTALESWGMAAEGQEEAIYESLLSRLASSDPLQWSDSFARIAWRLHPPSSVLAFTQRALADGLSEIARKDALTAIGYNENREAADAMLKIAGNTSGAIQSTALWWLLNRKDNAWEAHDLGRRLKEQGLYDPETLQLISIPLPDPVPGTFTLEEVMKLTGDAERGKTQSMRCILCHRIGGLGVDYGPDMTTWGRTQPTETILRSIIDPDADIAHGFNGTRVETNEGKIIDGIVINNADPLLIQSSGGVTQAVPKSRIKEKRSLKNSVMMTPAQMGLTAQDVADIAAFLKTSGPNFAP